MSRTETQTPKTIFRELEKYKVSKNLLRLEKDGQLVLCNTLHVMPLLVTQGADVVKSALDAVGHPSNGNPPGDAQLYETFHTHHLIVTADDEEKAPYIDFQYKPEERKAGMTMYLLMSQDCNLRCRYCFAHEFPYRQKEHMPLAVAKRAVDRNVRRMTANGSLSLVFFGGEPLMNWPVIKDLILYVESDIKPTHKKKTLSYHITTNLSILPDDFVEWVKKYKITLLTDVDGHRAEEHNMLRPTAQGGGSYEMILANIAMLHGEGIDVEVRSTICACNQEHIYRIAAAMKELTGTGAVLELVSPFDSSQQPIAQDLLPNIDRYIEDVVAIYRSGSPPVENIFPINKLFEKIRGGQGTPLGCGMPWGNIHVIDHRGDVYMCTYLVGQEEYKMGNVFDDGVTYSHEKEAVRNALMQVHVDHTRSCKSCSWKYLCSGHCPIARLAVEANERQGKNIPDYVKKYTFAKSCKANRTFLQTLLWDLATNTVPVPPAGKGRPDQVKEPACPV